MPVCIREFACLFVVKGTSNYADCKCWWNLRRWNFCSPMSALHIFASIPLILLGLTWGFASWGSRLRLSPDQVHRKTVRPAAYADMGHRNKVMFCYVDTGTLAIRAEQNISTLLYLFRAKNCLPCAALLFSDEWWVLYSFFVHHIVGYTEVKQLALVTVGRSVVVTSFLHCVLWQRPYHAEITGSRPITEVKQHRARLVLGWVTAWEPRVLLSFCIVFIRKWIKEAHCTPSVRHIWYEHVFRSRYTQNGDEHLVKNATFWRKIVANLIISHQYSSEQIDSSLRLKPKAVDHHCPATGMKLSRQ